MANEKREETIMSGIKAGSRESHQLGDVAH
jgi:hypothetical protein